MSKVILFEKTEKNFNTRGLGILTDIVNPVITEMINGIYDMSFFYPINGKLYNEITHERIVYAKGPKNYQAFRINSIEKSDLENGITVHAFHISYDLAGNFIEDTFIQNKGGDGAINQLLAKTTTPHNFTGTSNIQETFNSRIVRENVLNILIGTAENSFLNRAGGQFERDNFRLNWLEQIGKDRGVKIKYRKNLTGLTFKVDYSNVITRIMPQGFDALFLPEKYIDSPLIHQYSNVKIKNVKFDRIKSKKLNPNDKDAINHEEAIRSLRVQSKEYIEKLDKPAITADVSFIDLSQTEEYKQYKQLETIYIGDIVTVIHEPLGVELKKQMTSYQYDPILDSYIFMTLGDEKDFISGSVNSGTMALNKVEELKRELDTSVLEKYKEVATDLINSGFGGYTRYYKDRMLVMDTDDESTATKVWQFNKNGVGYSKTGVQGPYVYAWTIDGVFNADFIGANSITANKLSADVGQSLDLSSNVSINSLVNTTINQQLTDITIGARNFAQNSKIFAKTFWINSGFKNLSFEKFPTEDSEWNNTEIVKFANFDTAKNDLLIGYYQLNANDTHKIKFVENQKYTISFEIINLNNFPVKVKLGGFEFPAVTVNVSAGENKRVKLTSIKKDNNYEHILFYVDSPQKEVKFAVKLLKVEEGSKATSWTPSIEELEEIDINNKNHILNIVSDNEDLKKKIQELEIENLKLRNTISTELKQTKESFEFLFHNFQDLYDENNKLIQNKLNDFTKYIRFKNGKIEIGEINSPFKSIQEKNKIRFLYNNVEVAYFSNEKLYVTDGEFLNSLILGNFGFFPRQNGNLSFKKVGGR